MDLLEQAVVVLAAYAPLVDWEVEGGGVVACPALALPKATVVDPFLALNSTASAVTD